MAPTPMIPTGAINHAIFTINLLPIKPIFAHAGLDISKAG
jgi:hypothetical protein